MTVSNLQIQLFSFSDTKILKTNNKLKNDFVTYGLKIIW